MGRPKGFRVSTATRLKLSKSNTGHKQTQKTKDKIAAYRRSFRLAKITKLKIGRGVRHGKQNKIKVGLRFDRSLYGKFKRECRSLRLKSGPELEDLMRFWLETLKD